MIKKLFITLISIVGLGLSLSYGSFTDSGIIGNSNSSFNKNLNFIPNPLNIDSNFPDLLKFKYGRTDNGFIYLGVDSVNSEYGTKFGTVLFNYNDPECNSTIPNYDFYNALSSGNFIPYTYSINVPGYSNTLNYLSFCDKDGNCYYSCCNFDKSNNNITFTCGHGADSIIRVPVDITNAFPNSIFPVNNSPYSLGGGTGGNLTGGIELNSTESALNYFENYYGWNKNICYVGIDNITTLWGSSVPFQEGSGLDIFEVFEGLYGNTDLYKMYPWLNSWIINYTQRSLPSEDRLYLANYNSGTNQVDLYYDNLTFPFAGKPVALYFMADEVSYFTNNQTMGSDVVSYCYIKLKGGTYEDIIDNSTKQSIDQYTKKSNTNKGFNEDGTVKNIDYSGFGYYGSGELTGDNSLKGILERLFGDVDMLKSVPINSNYKILPDWLIISFIFVVLFKLLRKK